MHSVLQEAEDKSTHLSPETLRTILEDAIQTVLDKGTHHRVNAFVRNRKLTLSDLIGLIFHLQSSNLNIQIARFVGYDPKKVFTGAALTAARKKLSYHFFEEVFTIVKQKLQELNCMIYFFKGLRAIAIDGSNLPEETLGKDPEDLVKTRSDTLCRAGIYMVAAQDTFARMFVDMEIQRITQKNESAAAKLLCTRLACGPITVFIFDRGFHCFDLETQIQKSGHYYLVRAKKRDFYNLLPKKLHDQDGELDITVDKIFTSRNLKKNQNDDIHHYVQKNNFSYFDDNGEYRCRIRLLKIKIGKHDDAEDPDDEYEYLITNLSEEYTLDDIRKFYKSRWGIEVAFKELKRNIGLIAVHARKQDLIKQEIWAALTLCNLSSAAIAYCDQQIKEEEEAGMIDATTESQILPAKQHRYRYQTNRKYAMELCRDFFVYKILDEDVLISLIKRHKTPVKEGTRYFKRNVISRNYSNQHRLL